MEYYNENLEEIYYLKVASAKCLTSKDAFFKDFNEVTIEDAENTLCSLGYQLEKRDRYNNHQYSLNKLLLIHFVVNEKKTHLGYINIDGCYAAFEKNLEFCYQFIHDVNEHILKVKLFDLDDKEVKINLDSKEDFIKGMKEHFADEYNHFVEVFGVVDDLVMCDEDFYKLYKAKYWKKDSKGKK